MGASSSTESTQLINDPSLGYSPYVGVAYPLNHQGDEFTGHIFCFLPLPREGIQLTGLPVHVNGFFALSQNRHHLKWSTDEQHGKNIDDKSVRWNQLLIKEALPKAYLKLIESAIALSDNNANSEEAINVVYSCLPNSSKTESRWDALEIELFKQLQKTPFLFCENKSTWVHPTQACFATFQHLPADIKHIQQPVINCLCRIGCSYVRVRKELFATLKTRVPGISDLTPESMTKLLHQRTSYKDLSYSEKLDVLLYLCSKQGIYVHLKGIELLPVLSRQWKSFDKKDKTIYLCPEEASNMFPGSENQVLANSSRIGKEVFEHLKIISDIGKFQIKDATVEVLADLLGQTLKCKSTLNSDGRPTLNETLTISWLQNVWKYLEVVDNISAFKEISIVPILKMGTFEEPEIVDLVKLSDFVLVKSYKESSLPDGVCRCFEKLGIVILPCLPRWIPKHKVKHYIFLPTEKDVIRLFIKLYSTTTAARSISVFNRSCEWNDKQELVSFLVKCQFHLNNTTAVQFLTQLQLFRSVEFMTDRGVGASVSECRRYIVCKDFPENVPLPHKCLAGNESNKIILKYLGAEEVPLESLVKKTLEIFVRKSKKHQKHLNDFMTYFLSRFNSFENDSKIVKCASNVSFLKVGKSLKKPSEVFNPSISILQELLEQECLLPETNPSKIQTEILKKLGMKSLVDINASIILQVAHTLDRWTKEGRNGTIISSKADALMKVLEDNSSILRDKTDSGRSLMNCLNELYCIPIQSSRPFSYPECFEWFAQKTALAKPSDVKEASVCNLVGATMPTIVCNSEQLNKSFRWKEALPLGKVLGQLKMMKNCYSVKDQSVILAVKSVYKFLNDNVKLMHEEDIGMLADEDWVWTGNCFAAPKKIVIESHLEDIELRPHFYTLPAVFSDMKNLFATFGCLQRQSTGLLLTTLDSIQRSKHRTDQQLINDRQIVRNILDKLATAMKKGESFETSAVLMMVQEKHPTSLTLLPVSECTYNDDPTCLYEDNDNIHIVHEMIPESTARALGVKSITQKLLSEAEELDIQECGQEEQLTSRIHSLLEGYKDGLSVPKELIQNADDAGASVVKFLYDERQNYHCKEKVFSEEMKDFQGPALFVFNDRPFTQEDLENIQKLNGATKLNDESKIGKFGLGFCSVYNLTDLPSFITGSYAVFFDPHKKNLGRVGRAGRKGLKFKLPNKTFSTGFSDQLMPYNNIFGCNILEDTFTGLNGTLFRFPLRTKQQARESQICSTPYTHDEIKTLLEMFIKSSGNMLIFSQNVQRLELYHIAEKDKYASNIQLMYSVVKETWIMRDYTFKKTNISVLRRVPEIMKSENDYKEIHKTVIRQKLENAARKSISSFEDFPEDSKTLKTTWIISWAKGDMQSMDLYRKMLKKGTVPIAAVAIPCTSDNLSPTNLHKLPSGFYKDGHAFCFMPMPIITKLPVHINSCFAVTSDRRQLVSHTEDDKDQRHNSWNIALMEDALVKAQVHLLVTLAGTKLQNDKSYRYYDLWPSKSSHITSHFKQSFFKHLYTENIRIFNEGSTWLSFSEILYLDPTLRHSSIGNLAFEVVTYFKPRAHKTLVEIPEVVINALKQSNKENEKKIISSRIDKKGFFMIFLENVNNPFWKTRINDRNKLIVAVLKSSDNDVYKTVINTSCIPTEPKNALAKPREIIHPKSELASLFDVDEGYFPLDTDEIRNEEILMTLVKLGMNDTCLPDDLVIDRCKSVARIANDCCNCSYKRCVEVLRYLSFDNVLSNLQKNKVTLEKIKDVNMIPVLPRPKSWTFPWKSESECCDIHVYDKQHCDQHKPFGIPYKLGKPNSLYQDFCKDYVGMVKCLAEDSIINSFKPRFHRGSQNIFTVLGIKSFHQVTLQDIVDQAVLLIEEYKNPDQQYFELQRIHRILFDQFEDILKKGIEDAVKQLDAFEKLKNAKVVLIGKNLMPTSKVAFEIKTECKPYLHCLPESDVLCRRLIYTYLGVKKSFDIDDILEVIAIKSKFWGNDPGKDIDDMNLLLSLLDDIMLSEGIEYKELVDKHDMILAPDNRCELHPTYELVLENEEFETSSSMNMIHPSISAKLACNLGVKAKEERCFEDMSVGIPFGQNEKLVTRIHNLLKAYPCDSSIMKELLQNADDAAATEINFIKDYRNHSTERTFGSPLLQGPALCVFNNSSFTQEDIVGIHNLGEGSKSQDPNKIGQYGVGFNAVYHLTDTPSFLTKGPELDSGGRLCIFDPLCTHVPKATVHQPGQMCKVDLVKRNFPNVLLGYSSEHLLSAEKATVFRLPLRQSKSDLSIQEKVSTEDMDNILLDFIKEMYNALIFLKNVTCIKVSNITSGTLIEEYSVRTKLSQEAKMKKMLFFKTVESITKKNKNNKSGNFDVTPTHTMYEMQIDDTKKSEHFLVVQMFGLLSNEEVNNMKIIFHNRQLGQIPLGGIACPLPDLFIKDTSLSASENQGPKQSVIANTGVPSRSNDFVGKAFCTLPLPVCTGLPVHINGHFILDHEARRDLCKDNDGRKWNDCLMENNIVLAWHLAIDYFQGNTVSAVQKCSRWYWMENEVLKPYFATFPKKGDVCDSMWSNLLKMFYVKAVELKCRLFPFIIDREFLDTNKTETKDCQAPSQSKERFCISWSYVTTTDDSFNGVFDVTKTNLKTVITDFDKRNAESIALGNTLKNLGMQLITAPPSILDSIAMTEIENIPTASPEYVMRFLKSFDKDCAGHCNVGQTGDVIENTHFKTEDNLRRIFLYITLHKEYITLLDGLPVLLTADKILRTMSRNTCVFVTRYWKLLKGTCHLFLHDEVLSVIINDRTLFEAGYCKDFTTNDFVKLLPENMSEDKYGSGKVIPLNKDEDSPLSKEWIGELYDFLCEQSMKDTRVMDYTSFQQNLQWLENWSFLPVQKSSEMFVLVPFSKSHYAFYLSESYETDQIKVLLKINLPQIDRDSFSTCKHSLDARSALKRYVASPGNPTKLLQCLITHKKDIEQCNDLCDDDGTEILSFFERHLESDFQTDAAKSLLKELPLYLNLQGTFTSLNVTSQILLLPAGMSLDGMEEWACSCNTTLLQKVEHLNKLYQFLELKTSSILSVYAETILPTFGSIPDIYWMVHITYLRDQLRNCVEFDSEQLAVIQKLKHLAFIDSYGCKKKVSEMYCHKNEVFLQMMNESDFLPEGLRGQEWERFLEVLGLNVTITDEMLLQFARKIQYDGMHNISDVVQQKSNALVKSLQHPPESGWKKQTLKLLRDIHFVVPFTIDGTMNDIFPQKENASRLICFNQSVEATDQNIALCWSCIYLIPCNVCDGLNHNDRELLGIIKEPRKDSVVKHCQNICESIKQKLEDGEIQNEFVASQICLYIYEYFNSHKKSIPLYLTQLQCVPIIHLHEEKKMVASSDIVIDLSLYGEVKPYLYRAPVYHGRYHRLFEILGSKKTPSFEHYVRILKHVKEKVKDKPLNVAELRVVKRSLDNMVSLLDKTKENKTELDRLYLPTSKKTLENATTLTVSNNKLLEKRLDGKVQIDYFVGFPALDIYIQDPVPVFKRLPGHLQPSFLTEIVNEVVCKDKIQILERSRKARDIERLFHSDEFANAVCRLVKHQYTNNNVEFTEHLAVGLREKLLSVHALRVEGLETVLYIRENIVIGSERRKLCFYQTVSKEEKEFINFYFLENEEDDGFGNFISCNDGLAELVDFCTGGMFGKFSMRILTTLMAISDFQRFMEYLDESNIDAYDNCQGWTGSIFPRPGTYVESRFLPFLEQGIQPFEEYEFESLAMELEDTLDSDGTGDQEPIFIYVHILQEIKTNNLTSDIRRMYVVDTGDPYRWSENVPIYRLYRFVRKETPGRDIQMYDSEAVYKLPFDENCRRLRNILRDAKQLPEEEWKKIKRRLLLKWHPDKNLGKEAYCTKVFQYLQIIISRLENGEDIGEDIDEEIRKGRTGYPTTDDFYDNINKRARKHANAFKEHFNDYNQNTGSYSHTSKSGEKIKDPREANRWMRQAKKDFESAEKMISVVQDIPGFNWICYTCHQAAEKSLKAAWFYKDATLILRSSHSLSALAVGLNNELQEQAALLENRLGQHTRMRYPDSVSRPKIPSDVFDESIAKFSIEVTRKIITLAEAYIR